jgi:hypothetical protein
VLSPEISQRLGRELSERLATHPRAAELVRELDGVIERAREQRASDDDLRLAVAIVLALASGTAESGAA